jgi:hypothetical protein
MKLYVFIRELQVALYLSITAHSQGHPNSLIMQSLVVYYLACKLEDFHLASLMIRAQTPEELIFRWSAVRDPLVFQIP